MAILHAYWCVTLHQCRSVLHICATFDPCAICLLRCHLATTFGNTIPFGNCHPASAVALWQQGALATLCDPQLPSAAGLGRSGIVPCHTFVLSQNCAVTQNRIAVPLRRFSLIAKIAWNALRNGGVDDSREDDDD